MEKIGWIILQANQVDVASKVFILLLMAIISYGIGSIGSKRKIGFGWAFAFSFFLSPITVSYTHLTLPTICSV